MTITLDTKDTAQGREYSRGNKFVAVAYAQEHLTYPFLLCPGAQFGQHFRWYGANNDFGLPAKTLKAADYLALAFAEELAHGGWIE